MPVVTTSNRPLEARRGVYQKVDTNSFFETRSSTARPLSVATEIFDTDFEDESDDGSARKDSLDSDDSRRRSQTTISSYDEVPTPDSSSSRRPFEMRIKPVEGPKGPHLFRSSLDSAELDFEYGLQMSPMFPKETPLRTDTAFSYDTVIASNQPWQGGFSIDAAVVTEPECLDNFQEAYVRSWSTHQVVDWMVTKEIDAPIIDTFELNDINGAALLELTFDHLKELDIQALGKRLCLWNHICQLRGGDVSPQPTPFQDISRPCTAPPQPSPERGREGHRSTNEADGTAATPSGGKKRRGRKASKHRDVVTPAESVSIVAIEQLMPKPHKCDKGERCGKWRRQQREIAQLQNDHGLGTFPISPRKGGHVFVFGDPGNADTAANIVPNVHKQQIDDSGTLTSEMVIPSLVASSDLLGPGQVPEFALHEHYLDRLDSRDPQDNVRQFLQFQHLQTPVEGSITPGNLAHPGSIGRSESVPLFPAQHYQAYPSFTPPTRCQTAAPRAAHTELPPLNIPRSSSVGPETPRAGSNAACNITSPSDVYRLGTPASEMDVPLTAIPIGPISRDTSQSVPPDMQYRQQSISRSQSTRPGGSRRPSMAPSMALPAVKEGEVFSPTSGRKINRPSTTRPETTRHNSGDSTSTSSMKSVPDPAHDVPQTQTFGYGSDCTHAGWMKKRRTKLLRHEWQDAHFRLNGTHLAMHDSARLSSAARENINVEDYAVACSTVASTNKLAAAIKAFKNSEASKKVKAGEADPAAFAFQLVPASDRRAAASNKTHHFAVKNKDERIDWMREIMLARALQQKGKGYTVEINGTQA